MLVFYRALVCFPSLNIWLYISFHQLSLLSSPNRVSSRKKAQPYHVRTRCIEEVMKVLVASSQECPHRAGPLVDVPLFSLTGIVGQECAIETGVCVLHQFYLGSPDSVNLRASGYNSPTLATGLRTYQKCFIEFKQARELFKQLMNRIKPLEEHRTLFILVLCIFLMATAISKLVPKIQPIRLH